MVKDTSPQLKKRSAQVRKTSMDFSQILYVLFWALRDFFPLQIAQMRSHGESKFDLLAFAGVCLRLFAGICF